MNILRKAICLILPLLTLIGCNNSNDVKIVVDDIEDACDISCFRGIKSDMYYKDLVATVGEPQEIIIEERTDEEDTYDPIYYFEEGKIRCYWTGRKKDKIGLIEYTPYRTTKMQVENFIKDSYKYNITPETEIVAVFKEDILYYLVYLDDMRIRQIEYCEVKKNLFNIAGKFD